ncbi:MAG: HAD family phosphatase [Candidatus Margulisbacteria bacterium]|jgi:beta-phosphoglucomutase|nr:HAD family phosphatase [Candidatus Margulisiibacteriota bacterium]
MLLCKQIAVTTIQKNKAVALLSLYDIKAVLFDMDGTILNSMRCHQYAYAQAFQHYGIKNVTATEIYQNEGTLSEFNTLKKFLQRNNMLADEQLISKIVNYSHSISQKLLLMFGNQPIQYMPELIYRLKTEKYPLALVSGTSTSKIKLMLPESLYQNFNYVIGGRDVKNNKPDPECYLLAAKKLNVNPQNCLVIENSPNGIRAAKAAGMYCLAVTTTLSKTALTQADWIISPRITETVLFGKGSRISTINNKSTLPPTIFTKEVFKTFTKELKSSKEIPPNFMFIYKTDQKLKHLYARIIAVAFASIALSTTLLVFLFFA